MSKQQLPKTFQCPYCGHDHQIPIYAYAHWHDLFTVTCENKQCRKKMSFFQGKVEKIVQPRRRSKGENQ